MARQVKTVKSRKTMTSKVSLFDQRIEPIVVDPVFEQEKRRLHELYKLFKAGLIKRSDVSVKDKRLLRRYYGMDVVSSS